MKVKEKAIKKNRKKAKGITLIALVITIIVLLILAGVTLSLMLGENGVLKKAVESKTIHDREKAMERLKLVQNEYMVDNKSGKLNVNDDSQIRNWLDTRKTNQEIDEGKLNDGIIGICLEENWLYFYSDGTEVAVYNIEYDTRGGTNEANAVTMYRKGETIQLPIPTKEGAQFLGWSKESNNNDSDNIITSITENMEGDIKLYAYWLGETPKDYFVFSTNSDGQTATIAGFTSDAATKCANGEIKELVLPTKDKNGLPVTNIGVNAFSGETYRTKIEKLIVPDSIRTVQSNAFNGCTGIKYLKIPISLQQNTSFGDITNIEEVYFSKGTGIGINYGGDYSQPLPYLYTPWYLSRAKLTKVTLENGITSIGKYMFKDCINITDTWEHLINTQEDLESIGVAAFFGCEKITGELNFPSKITQINANTFTNCGGITSLVISDKISKFESNAFTNCTGIKYLKIPISVSYTNGNTFSGVTNIEEVYFSKGTGIGINYGGDYSQPLPYLYTPWYLSRAKLTKVTLENGITSIGKYMFKDCINITDAWEHLINTQEDLESIGVAAFFGCEKITGELNFPSKITQINANTFTNCRGITSLVISDKISKFESNAFTNCTGIKYLKIPISVSYTNGNTFSGVTNIEEVYFSKGTGIGINYGGDYSQPLPYLYTPWYLSRAKLTKVTLESGITSIGKYMFKDCVNITDTWEHLINTQEDLESIGVAAFFGCEKITGELNFPSKIIQINANTFTNCRGITSLVISDKISKFESNAFTNCTGIKYLKIPISVSYTNGNTFSGVTNIEEVYFSKGTGIGINYGGDSSQPLPYLYTPWYYSRERLTKVTLEKEITSIGNNTFNGCTNISEIYYTGTETEWNAITKGSNNSILSTVTVQYSN